VSVSKIYISGPLLLASLVSALAVSVAVAFLFLDMGGKDLGQTVLYLSLSGVASLSLAYGGLHLVLRSSLKMRHKIGLAGAAGSVIALVNVIVTSLLMFLSSHDLTLLIVLLLFSLIISLMFAMILASNVSASFEALSQAAQRLGQGDLSTRVKVTSKDDIGNLADVFNGMADDLEQTAKAKQQLERARKDLVAAASHDLRTPLASVQAMVEAMEDGVVSDPETVRRYLSTIRREIGQLSTLIDDLFELSRIDSGGLELQLRPSSVSEIVADALDSMRSQAGQKPLNFRSSVSDRLEAVLVDPNQMHRVLSNLIQNAIRHTPADGAILVEAQEQGSMIQIDVADTGQGIIEDDLEKVFERFYRGEKSRSREYGGSGLGLAIARGIVEAHGGWIQVTSALGQGSRFSFCIPKVP